MENSCHRKKNQLGEDKMTFSYTFLFYVYSKCCKRFLWNIDIVKMVLTPLNITVTDLLKVNGVNR
jgi:hypothetical protein